MAEAQEKKMQLTQALIDSIRDEQDERINNLRSSEGDAFLALYQFVYNPVKSDETDERHAAELLHTQRLAYVDGYSTATEWILRRLRKEVCNLQTSTE